MASPNVNESPNCKFMNLASQTLLVGRGGGLIVQWFDLGLLFWLCVCVVCVHACVCVCVCVCRPWLLVGTLQHIMYTLAAVSSNYLN